MASRAVIAASGLVGLQVALVLYRLVGLGLPPGQGTGPLSVVLYGLVLAALVAVGVATWSGRRWGLWVQLALAAMLACVAAFPMVLFGTDPHYKIPMDPFWVAIELILVAVFASALWGKHQVGRVGTGA
jgi:hypothetical protein